MNKELELYHIVYNICLKAALELGRDYKKLSWFGKNNKM